MKVNILGQDYEIINQTETENPKLWDKNAYTEPYSKKIIIASDIGTGNTNDEKDIAERQDLFVNRVVRHEIIHAFFVESGLNDNCDYATNEELVDWIAYQIPKIYKVFKELGVEE